MREHGYAESGPLTPRMRDVLRHASLGLTVRETGAVLYVSESTVRTIRAAACVRLGTTNVVAAVAVAIRKGEL